MMGLGAHLMWGFFPLYFLLIKAVPPGVILGHRVVQAAVAMAVLLSVLGGWPAVRAALAQKRIAGTLLVTATLVAVNWLIFIYAVLNGLALQAALGYFITPLFIVALGIVFLKERPRPVQVGCIGIACLGVAIKTLQADSFPWVAIALPVTFGFYSLFRKQLPIGSLTAMGVETFVLAPIGVAFLAFVYASDMPSGPTNLATLGLLAISGSLTVAPLLLFGGAAKRLTMTSLGFIQYFGPTCQMVLAVTVLGESWKSGDGWAFGLIWVALAIFTTDAVRHHRRAKSVQPDVAPGA
jgi:chloramphenicol-sensitive protein RarD